MGVDISCRPVIFVGHRHCPPVTEPNMKITVYARTNIAQSRCAVTFDIPDEAVAGANGERDEAKVEVIAKDALGNLMEWGWFEGEDRNADDRR